MVVREAAFHESSPVTGACGDIAKGPTNTEEGTVIPPCAAGLTARWLLYDNLLAAVAYESIVTAS